ncbi:MAG TPA: ATP-binding protein [Verrucomicrobiae bacterium]|nr:ATP-binding protein [Verrucomicrobiae bacterium]
MKSSLVFQLENAAWPALLLDSATTVCRANPAAIRLFGPALESSTALLAAIWSPDNTATPEQFLAQWERSPTQTVSLKLRTRGGNAWLASASICSFTKEGQRFFLLQILPDAPAAQAEEASTSSDASLAHKQKLDCALQLARTVALDFNNALTSILGHTSLVLSQAEPNNPWRTSLLEVEKSAARAAEIANDLGMFSRQEKEPRAQAIGNLNQLAQRTIDLFQQQAPSVQVSWSLLLEKTPFTCRFDEAKLQQALMRILENAVQAIKSSGRITIQTRNVELTDPAQDQNVRLAPGAYVSLEVTDDGEGIAPEVLPRVFEPFFTTKGKDHRGLGLAWVYGVVTNHGGGVAISSRLGAGTAVRLYLPAEKLVLKENGIAADDLRGTQTILMVDDEDLLLTMGQTILSAYGYRVLTANSGQKALDALTAQGPVDLIITDLVMPAMSGRELVEHIHEQSPGTPILCTSGYVWPAGHHNDSAYLQKPFTSHDLLLKVKQVLAA